LHVLQKIIRICFFLPTNPLKTRFSLASYPRIGAIRILATEMFKLFWPTTDAGKTAIISLAASPHPRTSSFLLEQAKASDGLTRYEILMWLGRHRKKEAIPGLLEVLRQGPQTDPVAQAQWEEAGKLLGYFPPTPEIRDALAGFKRNQKERKGQGSEAATEPMGSKHSSRPGRPQKKEEEF
jgi:hypothetical protein